ncbi:MAG: aspartate-semialdehyde dehydrogenase, partial [Oscillospiraceae bacterium]
MKIGILGATGAVGRQMMQCLSERKIKVDELRLFASGRSAGTKLDFEGTPVEVTEISPGGLKGL